jgi:hypothetical protein
MLFEAIASTSPKPLQIQPASLTDNSPPSRLCSAHVLLHSLPPPSLSPEVVLCCTVCAVSYCAHCILLSLISQYISICLHLPLNSQAL